MKVGMKVRIVDHEDYEDIHRVGEVGTVKGVKGEDVVLVMFKEGEDPVEYPFELVQEEEQEQTKSGGKDGVPDAGQPTPPQLDKDEVDDLSGEQDDVAQADSPESHASSGEGSQSAGVTSAPVKVDGEQKDVPQTSGGTSSQTRPQTGSSQSAGVTGQQVVAKGEQETNQPTSGGTGASKTAESVSEGVFKPISITMLEQGDGDDEYVAISEARSIRNEDHLVRAIRLSVHKALESMDRPFDRVEVVFRRDPIAESHRRKAERTLLAQLHLLDEGKGGASKIKEAAREAATLGMHTSRYAAYTEDKYARKILTEAERFINAPPGGNVKMTWPPKKMADLIGKHVVVDTVTKDRWIGVLEKAGDRLFQIKMSTGTKKFGMNDVSRILQKKGAK
jgi:hypothetical protein